MATARDDLEDLITCEICFLRFQDRDPRSLACLHAYCSLCLQSIYDTAVKKDPSKAGQIRCPTCQAVTKMPDNSIASLPKYFHASKVQDIIGRLDQVHLVDGDVMKCSICTTTKSTYCCLTCGQAMCETCHLTHDRIESHKNHEQLQVDEEQLKALLCGHHKAVYASYCVDCFVPVCKSCKLMANHVNHKHLQLIIARGANKSETIDGLKDVICKCKNGSAVISRLQQDIDDNVDDVIHAIAVHKQMLVDQLNEEEQKLTRMLKIKQDESKKKLKEVTKSLTQRQNQTETVLTKALRLVQPVGPVTSVTLGNLQDTISDLSKDIKKGYEQIHLPLKFVYTPEESRRELGEIKVSPREAFVRNDPIWQYFNNNLEITHSQFGSAIVANKPQLEMLWSSDVGASAKSLATFTNGETLVLHSKSQSITKMLHYDIKGRLQAVPLHIPNGYTPLKVAICRENDDIAILCMVGLTCEIIFLSKVTTDKYTKAWSPKFTKLIGEGFSVAFWAPNTVIVGGIINWTLTKYNPAGQILMTRNVNHACYDLAVCQNMIIASDRSNVFVYGEDFKVVSFFEPGCSPLLKSVVSVCVDDKNNTYMANTSGDIFKFSSTGKFVKTVLHQENSTCISVRSGNNLTVGKKTGTVMFKLQRD